MMRKVFLGDALGIDVIGDTSPFSFSTSASSGFSTSVDFIFSAPNAGIQPRRTAPNEGACFASFSPAQTIIADLYSVFQKWILADCKACD
jgi:hypothetical protein